MLQVVTPIITTAQASPDDPISITITCATAGATIHYTVDPNGIFPNPSSPIYIGSFSLYTHSVVNAYAIKSGMNDSELATCVSDSVGNLDGRVVDINHFVKPFGLSMVQIPML